ncbi:glycosyltransferase, partial [Raoultella planticola]
MLYRGLSIALIVPCYNEEKTIYQVVSDFKQQMPEIDTYVFDNCSTD